MNSQPTSEQVQQEIEALRAAKPKVRRRTFFGDDIHSAIDVQIDVLEDGLDEDTIYAEWEEDDYLLNAALEALSWRSGEDVEGLENGLAASWLEIGKG